MRDRALLLLLLGFAGGYRASDLARLEREHISIESGVLKVFLPRSKEDSLGNGRTTKFAARTNHALCPLRALEQWLRLSPDCTGSLFRVVQGARIEHRTLAHPPARRVTRGAAGSQTRRARGRLLGALTARRPRDFSERA